MSTSDMKDGRNVELERVKTQGLLITPASLRFSCCRQLHAARSHSSFKSSCVTSL